MAPTPPGPAPPHDALVNPPTRSHRSTLTVLSVLGTVAGRERNPAGVEWGGGCARLSRSHSDRPARGSPALPPPPKGWAAACSPAAMSCRRRSRIRLQARRPRGGVLRPAVTLPAIEAERRDTLAALNRAADAIEGLAWKATSLPACRSNCAVFCVKSTGSNKKISYMIEKSGLLRRHRRRSR